MGIAQVRVIQLGVIWMGYLGGSCPRMHVNLGHIFNSGKVKKSNCKKDRSGMPTYSATRD